MFVGSVPSPPMHATGVVMQPGTQECQSCMGNFKIISDNGDLGESARLFLEQHKHNQTNANEYAMYTRQEF